MAYKRSPYPPKPFATAQNGSPITAPGDTAENTLVSLTIPGGLLGPNGRIEVYTLWTVTSSANNKILRVKIGATSFLNITITTVASFADLRQIINRNAENSQVCCSAASSGGLSTSSGAVVTGAIDFRTNQTLLITGQKASAGEVLRLEAYSIIAYPSM